MTSNVALRNVQYKILHNTYPTMKHLFLWRIKESPNCTACQTPETTIHAVWDCNIAQTAINNLLPIYRTAKRNQNLIISKEDFVYGLRNDGATSTIFTLLKKKLILQRERKQVVTPEEIILMIKEEMAIEKYIKPY